MILDLLYTYYDRIEAPKTQNVGTTASSVTDPAGGKDPGTPKPNPPGKTDAPGGSASSMSTLLTFVIMFVNFFFRF